MSTLSGLQPQVAGSHQVESRQFPGSVSQTFEEATESTNQQSLLPRFYRPFRTRLLALSRLLFLFAEAPPSILPASTTVSLSRGEAGLALHDHRDLVVSLPPMFPNCWQFPNIPRKLRQHTHVPVETPSVNPPSQGCTTLTGINSVSLDLGMANQVGLAACSSATYTNPLTRVRFCPPPPKLWFSGYGPPFSYGFTAII